jgi:hypothetical protein
MMRGFYNGVSGIKTQSFGMDVWANNISNINNVGFKASIPEFKNLINQSLVSAGSGPTNDQVGLGATKQTTALDMSNGSFQNTDNNFDLAIGGKGFFGVVDKNGKNYYTRTGSFDIDAAGNLVDNRGNMLRGTLANFTPTTPSGSALKKYGQTSSTPKAYTVLQEDLKLGSESAQKPINLPHFLFMPAEATKNISLKGNLNSSLVTNKQTTDIDAAKYAYTLDNTNKTISLNGQIPLSTTRLGAKAGDSIVVKVKDGDGKLSEFSTTLESDGTWQINDKNLKFMDFASLKVNAQITSLVEVANTEKLTSDIYNADGTKSLVTINLTKQIPQAGDQTIWNAVATTTDANGTVQNTAMGSLTFNGSGRLIANTLKSVGSVNLNFEGDGDANVYNGMMSSANARKDFNIKRDGYAEGLLSRYSVDDRGNIMANFDNTRAFPVAKVALFHFINEQGVAKVGDNLYEATANSGEAFFYKNKAGETFYGAQILANKLEMSNVDLGQALSEVIVTQKAYEASAKSITTSDEMIQTAIQMKK